MKNWSVVLVLAMAGWVSVKLAATDTIFQTEPRARYSLQDARRVMRLIEKIERERRSAQSTGLNPDRKVTVSQDELNAYIAHRIEIEREEVMKELEFKLFPDNRIEAKIFIDLRGQKLPQFLRPEMTFYIGGGVETREGAVRLHIKELFLEGQSIQPAILDLVIMVASRISGSDSGNLKDWYKLPFGIRDVRMKRGKVDFFY